MQQVIRLADTDVLLEAWASSEAPAANLEDIILEVHLCHFFTPLQLCKVSRLRQSCLETEFLASDLHQLVSSLSTSTGCQTEPL